MTAAAVAGVLVTAAIGACSSSNSSNPGPPSQGDDATLDTGSAGDSFVPTDSSGGQDGTSDSMAPADAGDAGTVTDGAGDGAADSGVWVDAGCDASFGSGTAACNGCVNGTCCGMLTTCAGTAGCATGLQCFQPCVAADGGTYGGCFTSCLPSGADQIAYIELFDCVQNQCSTQCGYPPPDGGMTIGGDGSM